MIRIEISRVLVVYALIGGISFATPPQIIAGTERFFGAGNETFAVLRAVTDNKGSYYHSQTTTSLVERSKKTGALVKETIMLDREEIIAADDEGPGKPPVSIVIHAKDEKAALGLLLERWPNQGTAMTVHELQRFKVHENGVRFDDRLELMEGNPAIIALKERGFRFSDWQLEEGIDTRDAIFLKAIRSDGDGDSDEVWMCLTPEISTQVRAFRKVLPVYLSFGAFEQREDAIEAAKKIKKSLKTGKFSSSSIVVWKVNENAGSAVYKVLLENSDYVIKNGKVGDLEKLIEHHVLPISSEQFMEWIWIPEE